MHPARLRDVLESWCAAGVSGALRVLDPPGGTVYLLDGGVEYAECSVAAGIERLLTASGRLPLEVWRSAVSAGRAQNRVGAQLLETGQLSAVELESVALLALYDAAHFLFDLDATTQFEPGARHHLGYGHTLDLKVVCQEVDRRKLLLADAWPDPTIDTSAVVPQRRLRDQCVALTALQWEVVASADRRRTPVDLARLLGRDTFTVMLEVRRMVRAGLVEPGRPGGSAAAGSVAAVRANSVKSDAAREKRALEPEKARFRRHKRDSDREPTLDRHDIDTTSVDGMDSGSHSGSHCAAHPDAGPDSPTPIAPAPDSPAPDSPTLDPLARAIPLPRRPVSKVERARSRPGRDPAFSDDILHRLIAGLGSW